MYLPAPALQLVLLLWAILLSATSAADSPGRPPLLENLEVLIEVSADLVREARSRQAKATPFRIEVTLYKERLRALMLDNRRISDEKKRIPMGFLINMVRMSALLYSAAECKTGRYIVCPPELMRRLASQQQVLSKDIDSFKMTLDGTG